MPNYASEDDIIEYWKTISYFPLLFISLYYEDPILFLYSFIPFVLYIKHNIILELIHLIFFIQICRNFNYHKYHLQTISMIIFKFIDVKYDRIYSTYILHIFMYFTFLYFFEEHRIELIKINL